MLQLGIKSPKVMVILSFLKQLIVSMNHYVIFFFVITIFWFKWQYYLCISLFFSPFTNMTSNVLIVLIQQKCYIFFASFYCPIFVFFTLLRVITYTDFRLSVLFIIFSIVKYFFDMTLELIFLFNRSLNSYQVFLNYGLLFSICFRVKSLIVTNKLNNSQKNFNQLRQHNALLAVLRDVTPNYSKKCWF